MSSAAQTTRMFRHTPWVEGLSTKALAVGAVSLVVPLLGIAAVGYGVYTLRQVRRAERFSGPGDCAPSRARTRAVAGIALGTVTLVAQLAFAMWLRWALVTMGPF
ncbi:hypothetical protein [Streptomyces sp. ISL-100]|uniref:hypothetical protein n=1 Tax=Streptomyces sp. ISL-100 TaxID=2819173 RepID=UPI001BECC396|nr:hypothetical protein [Streptomyces sp. ISL-100]MBT2395814.1 DUF4190 domain-containing protein [Streptomyces sp. ISL-100]